MLRILPPWAGPLFLCKQVFSNMMQVEPREEDPILRLHPGINHLPQNFADLTILRVAHDLTPQPSRAQ